MAQRVTGKLFQKDSKAIWNPVQTFYISGNHAAVRVVISALAQLGNPVSEDGGTPYITKETNCGTEVSVIQVEKRIIDDLWKFQRSDSDLGIQFRAYQLYRSSGGSECVREIQEGGRLRNSAPVRKARGDLKKLKKKRVP